jgi:hypothetical protein
MSMLQFGCFAFLFFLTLSCHNVKKDDLYKSIVTVRFDNSGKGSDSIHIYPNDSVIRIVPEFFRLPSIRNERKKIESALQIGSLENGFQKRQFRISGNEYKEYKDGWTRLLIFKNTSDWFADIYYMRFAGEDGFSLIIDSLQYQKYSLGFPKVGWKYFIDSLNNMGLFSLPDCDDVPGYLSDMSTDELSYDVELASNKAYRIYSYYEPMERSIKFRQAKQLMEVVAFIKTQFYFPEPLTPPDPRK